MIELPLLIIAGLLGYKILKSRKTRLRTPGQVTRYVVRNFDKMQLKDWRTLEAVVQKHDREGLERNLIYALRISSVIPTTKTLKTLISRAENAWIGNGTTIFGLLASERSSNYKLVETFLINLYSAKFHQLSKGMPSEKAQEAAAQLPFKLAPSHHPQRP